jgi:hypothetical protein
VKEPKSVQAMRRRHRRLAAQLGKLGLIIQGTVLERKPAAEPYPRRRQRSRRRCYQWTRKINGKTVTVALSSSQAKVFQEAIDNHRTMQKITHRMRQISLQILQATTQGVKRRKPRS